MTPGRLEVIAGPMFSGKSAELVTRMERATIAHLSVAVLRPSIDTRVAKPVVVSRNGLSISAIVVVPSLLEGSLSVGGRDVVAFDEAQFFDDALIRTVRHLLANGTRVVVAGLDLDYAARPYGPMPYLLALADVVDKLTAVCAVCRSLYATRTQRLVDSHPAPLGPRDIIDQFGTSYTGETGVVSYEARCTTCYVPPV